MTVCLSRLFHIQIAFQCFHIILKGFQPYRRNAAKGTGFLALEGLFHLDVANYSVNILFLKLLFNISLKIMGNVYSSWCSHSLQFWTL